MEREVENVVPAQGVENGAHEAFKALNTAANELIIGDRKSVV